MKLTGPIRSLTFLFLMAILAGGCDLIRFKNEQTTAGPSRVPVARVNEVYLYQDEIVGIADPNSTPGDSAVRVNAYIDSWIRKQLIIQEAMKRININEAEVERKVLDYRYSLIGYEYQNVYIRQHLDDSITSREIENYYRTHIDNFVLKQNIVKGTYIKVPRSAPKTDKIKGLIFSAKQKDHDDLKSYCLSFSSAYHLGDSSWIEFDKLVVNSPIAEIPNKIQFLKTIPYYETNDESYLYFLKVDDYKISDNVSPLEFVKEDIRNILINKRKVELAKALEDEVYENAVRRKDFEIYSH